MKHFTQQPARESGTFTIGGDLTVYRLGFGAMRLTGPGIWGPPEDRQEAIAVLLIASIWQRKQGVVGVRSASQATALSPEKEAQL